MILAGASGHAKVIIDILEQNRVDITCLVDVDVSRKSLLGYDVKEENEIELNGQPGLVAVGDNAIRAKIANKLNLSFQNAIHPAAVIGNDIKLGVGTAIMAGAVLNGPGELGNHIIVNTSASIDHDHHIHNYVHVAPQATLCGDVTVKEGAFIGARAVIIPGKTVGKWAVVGAGAVVINDVPDHALVVGNPARVVRYLR